METKSCLICYQSIDARARKCQHCREVQSKTIAWMYDSRFIAAFMVLLVLLLCWVFYSLVRGADERPFAGTLTVGAATMRKSAVEGESRVSCLAPVTNSDTIHWGRLSLQAEFLDAQGRVIDVHNNQGNFAIFPGITATGRTSGTANAALEEYSACRMKIIDARAGG